MRTFLDRVVVVLVQPLHPGNVGAAARAMRNTGLGRLIVVDPPAFDMERARWMAPGCDELLDGIRVVHTLDEALEGVHRVIATTARHRRGPQQVHPPRDIAHSLATDDPDVHTAILFGREDFGLSREHSDRAEVLLRIPTPEHASLNLGQAVLLVGWELFRAAMDTGLLPSGRWVGGDAGRRTTSSLQRRALPTRRADASEREPVTAALVALLHRIGYTRGHSPEQVQLTVRAAFHRAELTLRDVHTLRGMAARMEWALDHPELDWTRGRSTSGERNNSSKENDKK